MYQKAKCRFKLSKLKKKKKGRRKRDIAQICTGIGILPSYGTDYTFKFLNHNSLKSK